MKHWYTYWYTHFLIMALCKHVSNYWLTFHFTVFCFPWSLQYHHLACIQLYSLISQDMVTLRHGNTIMFESYTIVVIKYTDGNSFSFILLSFYCSLHKSTEQYLIRYSSCLMVSIQWLLQVYWLTYISINHITNRNSRATFKHSHKGGSKCSTV